MQGPDRKERSLNELAGRGAAVVSCQQVEGVSTYDPGVVAPFSFHTG